MNTTTKRDKLHLNQVNVKEAAEPEPVEPISVPEGFIDRPAAPEGLPRIYNVKDFVLKRDGKMGQWIIGMADKSQLPKDLQGASFTNEMFAQDTVRNFILGQK